MLSLSDRRSTACFRASCAARPFRQTRWRACLLGIGLAAILFGGPQAGLRAAEDAPPAPAENAEGADRRGERAQPSPAEQQLAALAQAQSLDTEVLWLETQRESFLGLFHPDNTGNPKGAVVILPDAQTSPDWPELIRPLRLGLPDRGWPTLAIALADADGVDQPAAVPPAPQASDEAADATTASPLQREGWILERVAAAMNHLSGRGHQNQLLIGVGTGAYWAARVAVAQDSGGQLQLVLIDPAAPGTLGEAALLEVLGQLSVTTLDLYHGNRLPSSRAEQQARRREQQALRLHQASYYQLRLPGQPADWKTGNRRLLGQVAGAIRRYIDEPAPQPAPPATAPRQRPPG